MNSNFHAKALPCIRRASVRWLLVGMAATATAFMASHSLAADRDVSGVKVSLSLNLAGKSLELNGAGTRYRGPFKVYTAALYTTKKFSSVPDFHADNGSKRLVLTMLREVDSAEMGRMFINGVQKNMAKNDLTKVLMELPRMGEIFAANKRLFPGEQLVIDWVPAVGMQISVRGKPQGEAFNSPEFFEALMNIWLGKAPADSQLKDALLGKAEPERLSRS
jgi:hypothetical protein